MHFLQKCEFLVIFNLDICENQLTLQSNVFRIGCFPALELIGIKNPILTKKCKTLNECVNFTVIDD